MNRQSEFPQRLRSVLARVAALVVILVSLSAPARSDEPSEESMAAYADAANFQTGGAIDLAIEGWNGFLRKYPDHSMVSQAAHYLGVCHMQKESPDYNAANKAFAQALKNKKYDLREESLANHGWCLYAAAGDGDQRDSAKSKRAIETYKMLADEFPKSRFLDRALFYSGEASYGLGEAQQAIGFYNKMLSMPDAKESPLRCDAIYARGVAYEELDQFDKAYASYKQLLESCAKNDLVTDVHLRTGDLMILRKEFEPAVESFEKAIESTDLEDDRGYALFRQAYALVQAERPSEAAEKYEVLLKDYPKSQYAAAAVLASAQSTYRSGDIKEATKRFQKVLGQNNKVAATEAAHWLARIAINNGDGEAAAKIANTQIKRGVEGNFVMDLRLDYAEALSMDPKTVGKSTELFEEAYRAAKEDPLAPRALYNAAFSALQTNQPKKALEFALEFIQNFPKDVLVPDVKFVAAEGQLLTGKAKDAADTYKHLLASSKKENVQRPVWLLRAGATCNAARQFDDTVEVLSAELDSLPKPTQKAEAHMLIGRAHMMSGRPGEAAKSFSASKQADPGWAGAAEAMLLAGQAQAAAGNQPKAKSTWMQLIKASPKSRMADQARYKLAQLASTKKDYDEAIQLYDQILKSDQDPGLIPYAQYGKGWVLMQAENYKPALAVLDRMLQENKQHPLRNDATLARGISLRNLGKYQLARADLEAYLALPPKGVNLGHTLYELALIDQKQKKPGEAAKKLAQLAKEVPEYPSMEKVLYELGWSYQESGNDKAAVEHFTDLVSRFPNTSFAGEAAYFVGQKHYAAQRWGTAAEQFMIAASKATEKELSEKAHYRLGWSHFKDAKYEQARAAFSDQAKTHPKGKLSFDAIMMIGECQFKQADFKAALDGYRVARNRVQENKEDSTNVRNAAERQVRELVYLHGGQSAAQLKEWDEAIGWYNELRERFPASDYLPQVFYETGFAYQQKGDTKDALKFFQEVADNYRNELAARARFMMGEIHFAERQFDKAIPEFQRVMFGFGADKAPAGIKNWQAKSGFEGGRCSELLMQNAKTATAKAKALKFAQDFFSYVIEKHPDHELVAKSRERAEALKK
ncbi:MAG: tetratricopeptide repeat protein [Rubripirellula sp.]